MSNYSSSEEQRQYLRRSTLDLQDWANWRHQQTINQLQKLKEESNGKQSQECTFTPKIPDRKVISTTTKSTPSKLMNRVKNNENKTPTTIMKPSSTIGSIHTENDDFHYQPPHVPPPPIPAPSPSPSPKIHSDEIKNNYSSNGITSTKDMNRIVELETELQNVQAERDELLRERKFWLAKVQTDNTKLMNLLQNVKTAKAKLLEEIETVEKEKDRLKNLQIDGLESTILDKVLSNSSLSKINRAQLPAHLRAKAEEVHKTLTAIALRCRANQSAIFEFIITKIEEAEAAFVARKEDLLENIIDELSAVASSSPGNVLAAINISKNFPEPLLAALLEKRDEVYKRDSASHEGIVSNGAIELVDSGAPTDDASIKALMAQNTTLRSSIAQLRKKNAELKNKLQSVTNTPSSSSRRPRTSSKANRDHRKDSSLERSDNESTEDEDSDHNAPLPSQSHKLKSPGPSSNTPSTPVSSSSPEIEASIQGVVDEALLAAIKETVRANPLSEKIPVTVLQETLQEIRSEIKSQVALTISVSSSRFHWSQRIKEYSESYFETKRSDQSHEGSITVPADVKEEIQSMVKKSLSIPAVYSELISLTMLALTYTHSRVSIIEGTLPSAGSGTNTTVPSTPYDYDDIPPTATANSQPTLYHPDDSLSKHKTIHDYQQQEIFKGSSQQRTPRQTLQMKTTKKR